MNLIEEIPDVMNNMIPVETKAVIYGGEQYSKFYKSYPHILLIKSIN